MSRSIRRTVRHRTVTGTHVLDKTIQNIQWLLQPSNRELRVTVAQPYDQRLERFDSVPMLYGWRGHWIAKCQTKTLQSVKQFIDRYGLVARVSAQRVTV